MYKVFIDGGSGTTGLKIHEYFAARDDIELLTIEESERKNIEKRAELINKADASFLCLPDQASKEIVQYISPEARVLDTSTAHRTAEGWTYGFPELCQGQKEAIRKSNRIAVPGCHATGAIAAVKPLLESGILKADYPVAITSLTGYSGGGKSMIADYENPDRSQLLDSPAQYGLTQTHKHIPEIMKYTGLQYKPSFMPIVADYFSGMEVTVPLHGEYLRAGKDEIRDLFKEYYADGAMVEVVDSLADGKFIYSNKLAGTNKLKISIEGNEDNILIVALYDNLGKGASGAAIQNMNIMLGIEETKGLI